MSATDPHPVEPPTVTETPRPAPKSAGSEKDAVSPREKRKMEGAVDDFVNRTD